MTGYIATRIATNTVEWPADEPIAPERIIQGAPVASTLVLQDTPTHQLGLWRVTPGEFVTDHSGYVEYVHVLGGAGQLIDDDGTVTELTEGTTVLMQPGWKGRWRVVETISKVFTVIYTDKESA